MRPPLKSGGENSRLGHQRYGTGQVSPKVGRSGWHGGKSYDSHLLFLALFAHFNEAAADQRRKSHVAAVPFSKCRTVGFNEAAAVQPSSIVFANWLGITENASSGTADDVDQSALLGGPRPDGLGFNEAAADPQRRKFAALVGHISPALQHEAAADVQRQEM